MDGGVALVVGALVAGIAALGGSWLTSRTAQQERKHALEIQHETWIHEMRERFTPERRRLYADLLTQGDDALRGIRRLAAEARLRDGLDPSGLILSENSDLTSIHTTSMKWS